MFFEMSPLSNMVSKFNSARNNLRSEVNIILQPDIFTYSVSEPFVLRILLYETEDYIKLTISA